MQTTPTGAQRRTLTPKLAATRWSLESAARRICALAAGGMSVPEIRLRFPVPADWPDDSTMMLLQCGRGLLTVDEVILAIVLHQSKLTRPRTSSAAKHD
jgi:hypothetical protein